MTLALINNQTEIVKYLLDTMPELNYKYVWMRPSSSIIGYNDRHTYRDEVFPLICCIVNKNAELFSYLYDKFYQAWGLMNLMPLLWEVVASESLHLVSYFLNSFNTKSMFVYLPYGDM